MPRAAKKKPAAKKEAPVLDDDAQPSGSRAFWSGTISFGLVTIPVELYAATRSTRGSLRMLSPSGTPVARRYFTEDGKPVDNGSLTRGYELDKGEFVLVTDEELEQLAPEQSRDIDLSRFVDRAAIPPLFFERAYILAPTGQSNAAYRLLCATLERTDKAGIASFVMRGKQYIVAIVGKDGLLRAETLRFAEELRTPEAVGLPKSKPASEAQVKAMRSLITREKASALPEKELVDTYWHRLEQLVEKKRKKNEDVITPEVQEEQEENLAEVIDLVAILKKSLGEKGAQQSESKPKQAAKSKRAPGRASDESSSKATTHAPKKTAAKKKTAQKSTHAKPRSGR
ncbi:MAG: ykoV 1 [Myxococcaceae bacterium]|nr:ykoV 1 [Myxococcaceae bacterium]